MNGPLVLGQHAYLPSHQPGFKPWRKIFFIHKSIFLTILFQKIKISKKFSTKNSFYTLIGNAYTINLKNYQVLKLKYPFKKDWRSIIWRVWQKGPLTVLIGLKWETEITLLRTGSRSHLFVKQSGTNMEKKFEKQTNINNKKHTGTLQS